MSDTFVDRCLNPTGRVALALLTAMLSKDQNSMTIELVFDLSCLCRTLRALSHRFRNAYVFSTAQLQTLEQSLRTACEVLEKQTQIVNERVLDIIARTCTAVNRVMAETRYILALPSFHLIYPSDLIVERDSLPDRYNMQKDCVLESNAQLNERVRKEAPLWSSLELSKRAVYEHVGRLDGGEDMYDPTAEFFTTGRVFSLLWHTQRDFKIDEGVAHYDFDIEAGRRFMTGLEGVFTGPYRGPSTARWFIVVRGSDASCFCLSIVTLPAHLSETYGRRYISIACTSSNDLHAALQIQSVGPRPNNITHKGQHIDMPPPSSLPTKSLPLACSDREAADVLDEIHGRRPTFSKAVPPDECQRIKQLMERRYYVDTKRLVEVESSVKVRNVGLVQGSEALDRLISIAGTM